jgi:hypothetical protein
MIPKPINEIKIEDVQALIDNEIQEGKTIEYKEILPLKNDADRKEFLADISAFANASGGDLIYGIVEKRDANGKSTGLAGEIKGLEKFNEDHEILRLENIIQNGLTPRISGFQSKVIEVDDRKHILILRIPKSWAFPHAVVKNDSLRFYSRGQKGKFSMDMEQIRSGVIQSETHFEKIQNFRKDRIDIILKGERPVEIDQYSKVVLHIVPLAFDDSNCWIDLKEAQEKLKYFRPLKATGGRSRFNFDGFLTYDCQSDGKSISYMQFFRSGIIETVSANLIRTQDSRKIIAGTAFIDAIIKTLDEYLKIENDLGINPPLILMLSLLNVKGFEISTGGPYTSGFSIEKDDLLFSEILVENFEDKPSKILKPIFDMVWQSCGLEECPYVDA